MLAPDGVLGAVRADRDEAEERVEREARERARVVARAQIALGERGLHGERHEQHGRRERERERRAPGVQPRQRARRDDELDRDPHELPAQSWQRAQPVREVGALRHVRHRSALKVAIAEARNLAQEGPAQPDLEPTARAAQRGRDGPLEREKPREHDERERDEILGARRAARAERQPRREPPRETGRAARGHVEQTAKDRGLEHGGAGREHEGRRERAPAQEAVVAQEAEQRRRGARGRLVDGGAQLEREFGAARVVERRRAPDAHPHGAAPRHLLRAGGRGRRRRCRREPERHDGRVGRGCGGLGGERLAEARGLGAGRDGARARERSHGARGPVERGELAPGRIGERVGDERLATRRDAEPTEPLAERRQEALRARPLAERRRGDAHRVDVDVAREDVAPHPAPPARGIHHLHPRAVRAPHDDEVQDARGQAHDDDRRQRVRARREQMIDGHHDLLGVEPDGARERLERVDRRAVDGRLAGLAQPPVAHGHAEALEQALERRGPTVHGRGLDDLGREESPDRTRRPGQRQHGG